MYIFRFNSALLLGILFASDSADGGLKMSYTYLVRCAASSGMIAIFTDRFTFEGTFITRANPGAAVHRRRSHIVPTSSGLALL
jgi:hypothetical protein